MGGQLYRTTELSLFFYISQCLNIAYRRRHSVMPIMDSDTYRESPDHKRCRDVSDVETCIDYVLFVMYNFSEKVLQFL